MADFLKMVFGDKINRSNLSNSDMLFKLPIEYLPSENLFPLSDIVVNDLELISMAHTQEESKEKEENHDSREPLYHYLMNPENEYAKKMITRWKKYITTDTEYLMDTQCMLQHMTRYEIYMNLNDYKVNHTEMQSIWRTLKEDATFLEKYSYMEFEMFKDLNKSPTFLQIISVINMSSPILSFVMPIMCLIIPFILLKIQGIPISISAYVETLQSIARHHMLGKIVNGFSNFNVNMIVYLLLTIGLYFYQLYQNYMTCIRFYRNTNSINKLLIDMKSYLKYSILSMNSYYSIIKTLPTYQAFTKDFVEQRNKLQQLLELLEDVRPFEASFSKIGEIGILMKCFYELHSDIEYEIALKYSFEFEGYINNLLGISRNLVKGTIHMSDFNKESNTFIEGQFYPAHIMENYVTNDCDLSNNIIITGPNASGKTTFLKTTALNIIFSQQFGCGFYKSANITPYTHIHSYLNIPDTSGRDSLFQAESRRCKDILDIIENFDSDETENASIKHFAMFDELYSGTNPIEATKSAYSFLKYLSKFENVDYILTTHYVTVCDKMELSDSNTKTWKMGASQSEDGDIKYSYKIEEGISKIEGAIKVLRDMKYPKAILEEIENFC